MTFLHAAFLAGSALVAVPIVLHLVMRRQPKQLEFPALRLLRRRQSSNRRRLRLRQLLLLALRCAAIALLALAMARPSVVGSGMLGDQEAPVAAALVFDTSPRMQYRHANQTRLAAAQETGLWLLSQLPAESEVAVVDAHAAAPVFSVDEGAARQRIRRLDSSALARPLPAVVAEALRLVNTSAKQRKELYVFTDLAAAAWSDSATAALRQRLAASPGTPLYLIDVGVSAPQNISLGELRLSGQVLSRNSRLQVAGDVAALGVSGPRAVELALDPQRDSATRRQQSLQLRAGERQRFEFGLGGLAPGVHRGTVRIAGADGLAIDDVRYFTVEIKPAWKVLLAAAPDPAMHALFLQQAIAPHSMRVQGTAAFECDVVELGELGRRDLGPYAAVCLLDPPPLATEVWQKLSGYVVQGGAVGVFLGRNARGEPFNQPAPQELLPGPLARQWRAGEEPLFLAPDNLQHPLLSRFRAVETAVPWDGLPVFRHWQFASLAKGVGVIARYSNDQPAILEKPLGKGRVVTFTTPVSEPASRRDAWNLLPTGDEPWPFVILANETMYYLVGRGEAQLNYRAGDTAILRPGAGRLRPLYLLTTPRGDQFRQSADEKQQVVIVTSTDTPGNYQLAAGGQEGAIELGFSANLSAEATRLERTTPEKLKAALGELPLRIARNRQEIDRNVNLGRVGRELYPLLILLLAGVLAGEYLLANRFYRRPFDQRSEAEESQAARAQIERTRHEKPRSPVAAP